MEAHLSGLTPSGPIALGRFFSGSKEKVLYGFFENYHAENTRKKFYYDLEQFGRFIQERFPGLTLLEVDHDHITCGGALI
ncbi:MAG: hypothetical protein HQK52_16975 [Oligoflexia bacterium]|nr:hypothetical protein [Oligoflexia bacterium]